MAAFFAKNEVAERGLDWTVDSAGLYAAPGMPMSPLAVDALTRRHVPIAEHSSKPITEEMVEQADAIFVMTASHARSLLERFPKAEGKVHMLGRFLADSSTAEGAECDIVDPFGGSDEEYEACARDLQNAVKRLMDHFMTNQHHDGQ
jgi:protein-tyrosine-phosphatase